MAELKLNKLNMQTFKDKSVDVISKELSSNTSKLDTGSCSAAVAALSFAMLLRAAAITEKANGKSDELDYIIRNSENLRQYMVHLIDEDVKCRNPLTIAFMENDQEKIDACLQPACAINAEVINIELKTLELASDLKAMAPDEAKQYILQCAELSMAAIKMSKTWILERIKVGSDETYDFITKRENEIYLQQAEELYGEIIK